MSNARFGLRVRNGLVRGITEGLSVIDPDVFAFITAAGITDVTQFNAINQLVIDLKTYGLWIKMKAIYPFVGGTASAHKFNLKDPRDLDVAFRLVFNGGWAHTITGALPNGTNGYADSKFNPIANSLTYNDNHISIYSRSSQAGGLPGNDAFYEIGEGNFTGSELYAIHCRRLNNQSAYDTGNFVTNRLSYTNTEGGDGFFLGKSLSGTAKYYRNNITKVTDSSLGNSSLGSYNVYIGGFNEQNSTIYYAYRQIAFASMGSGLTDIEASNFYTAVQAFQTTLSRNV